MNPYSIDPNQNYSPPPSESGASAPGESFNPLGNQLSAGAALDWYSSGFERFKASPGVWIAMAVILFVLYIIAAMIPIIGSVASNILTPVFFGGFMLACHAQFQGKSIGVEYMFEGFKAKFGPLALLGLFWMIGMFVIAFAFGLVAVAFIGGAALTGAATGMHMSSALAGLGIGTLVVVLLVMILLCIPLAMAIWFAPALVVFHNIQPIDAIMMSLKASLKNWSAFILYFILYIVFAILATIPLGLGWLVFGPVVIAAMYGAYRSIFLVPGTSATQL